MTIVYNAVLEPDPDGGFVATFPDLPEAIAGGPTRDKAIGEATEALGTALRGRWKDGTPLPKRVFTDGTPVAVSLLDGLKLAVLDRFAASALDEGDLARRLDGTVRQARQVLDPFHRTQADALEAALRALGAETRIEIVDLAA